LRHDSKNSREQLASFPARMCHAVRRYTPSLWLGPTELSKTSLRATPPSRRPPRERLADRGNRNESRPLFQGVDCFGLLCVPNGNKGSIRGWVEAVNGWTGFFGEKSPATRHRPRAGGQAPGPQSWWSH
jgi:hypothetical protein